MSNRSSMFGLSVFGESKDSLHQRIQELETLNSDLTKQLVDKQQTINHLTEQLDSSKKEITSLSSEHKDLVNALDDVICKHNNMNQYALALQQELDKWQPVRLSNGRFTKKE